MGEVVWPSLNPPEEVMTSGPGTIRINLVTDALMQVNALAWSGQFSFGRLLWGFDSSHEFSLSVCLCAFRLSVQTDAELPKGGVATPPSNELPVAL